MSKSLPYLATGDAVGLALGGGRTTKQDNGVKARHSSAAGDGTNEHYTPPPYVEASRATLGGIDLDPFSCVAANRTVKAKRFYSLAAGEDGFALPWSGRVFCNPPGSKREAHEDGRGDVADPILAGKLPPGPLLVALVPLGALPAAWRPQGLYILAGKSPRGDFLHAVVARGSEVVHDPHPSRSGVLSHADATLIVQLDPSKAGVLAGAP